MPDSNPDPKLMPKPDPGQKKKLGSTTLSISLSSYYFLSFSLSFPCMVNRYLSPLFTSFHLITAYHRHG